MYESLVSENIYLFEFAENTSTYRNNITALLQNNRALLIDVSYARHTTELKRHLYKNGINNFTVLLSHHHEDHFDLCKCFLDSCTYASKFFLTDHQTHLETDNFLKKFKPDKWLVDNKTLRFGNFKIDFIYTPGHNKCGFSFLINDTILHAGDLIFENSKGLPSIPYLDENSTIDEYIYSLQSKC